MDGPAINAAITIFAAPAVWNLLAHYEYFTGKITKLCGNSRLWGYRVTMYIIITMQLIRNWAFYQALEHSQPMVPELDGFLARYPNFMFILSWVIFIIGWFFSLTSFWRLGFKGTYEADAFGFLFDEMITKFPFGTIPHPMYTGGALAFLGSALHYYSSTGIILTLWSVVIYFVFSYLVEQPLTELIYINGKNKRPCDEKKQE